MVSQHLNDTPQLIANSASGDVDEVSVSFDSSSLSFKTTTGVSLSNGYRQWTKTHFRKVRKDGKLFERIKILKVVDDTSDSEY